MKILFISDFFSSDLIGGAEKNDDVLLNFLSKKFEVQPIRSDALTEEHIKNNNFFIISNFVNIPKNILGQLSSKKFIIYEHDHKYVDTRNPLAYLNFEIPQRSIRNKFLYKRAHKVFVLSSICKTILEKNLRLNNVINIGTSLWSDSDLSKLENILHSKTERKDEFCVLRSTNPIKGYQNSINFLKSKNLKYNIITSTEQESIWQQMRQNKNFIFLPTTLETFSRISCEAKMLDCNLLTKPSIVGFFSENINLSGTELITEIRSRISIALRKFEKELLKMSEEKKTICFIGKFEELYDEEGKARALEKVGFRVLRFDEQVFNNSKIENQKTLFDTKPDYVFFTKLRTPQKSVFLEMCASKGIKTVCWLPDLYFNIEREAELLSDPIFKSDYVFTPDGGNQSKFEKLNINHICVRQGVSEEYLSLNNQDKDIDILFVGTLNPMHLPYRKMLLDKMVDVYGERFQWYGKYNDREVRNSQLESLYSRAKIVIGDCVESDSYWSNRVYEVTARGGFLIHPKVNDLELHFEDRKDIVFFERHNLENLIHLIDFYIDKEELRNEISKSGYEKTKSKNLLIHRANKIKEIIL